MSRFQRHIHHGRPDGWQDDISNFIQCDSELPISGLQASPKIIRAQARDLDAINGMSMGSETEVLPPMAFRRLGSLGMAAAESQIPPAAEAA